LGLTLAGPILPLYWVKPAGVPKLIGARRTFFGEVFLRDNYRIDLLWFQQHPYRFVKSDRANKRPQFSESGRITANLEIIPR